MICPRCQTEGRGGYCQEGGAPADGAGGKGGGDPLPAGANYCTGCGDPVREKKVSTPWAIATIATLALAIVLLVPTIRGGGSPGVGSFGGDALSPEMGVEREGIPSERSEEHTSELQSRGHLVVRLLLVNKQNIVGVTE